MPWKPAALALLGAATMSAACGEPSYVFLVRTYVGERDCLRTADAFDVMRGTDPGACAARCVSVASPDGGARATLLALTCGPLPVGMRDEANVAWCRAALDAEQRSNACFADGGARAPLTDASAE